MAPTTRLPPKKDVALALLEQASMYVHLDPRGEAVQVPLWFKKQPQLVLQVGLNMAVPIPDLHVDDQGLSCTLSFNRAPHFCLIPWASVFALVGANGQAMVWAEDVPAEVAAQAQKQPQPEKPRGGHLRSVADAPAAGAPAPAAAGAASNPVAEKKKRVAPAAKTESAKASKPAAKKKAAGKPPAAAATNKAVKPAAKKKAGSKSAAPKAAAPKPAPVVSPAASKQPAPQAQPAQKQPAAEPAQANSKPKRELPPYLRVVK